MPPLGKDEEDVEEEEPSKEPKGNCKFTSETWLDETTDFLTVPNFDEDPGADIFF